MLSDIKIGNAKMAATVCLNFDNGIKANMFKIKN
jgi:hypothetical protein